MVANKKQYRVKHFHKIFLTEYEVLTNGPNILSIK